jgi:hypothetical protein
MQEKEQAEEIATVEEKQEAAIEKKVAPYYVRSTSDKALD